MSRLKSVFFLACFLLLNIGVNLETENLISRPVQKNSPTKDIALPEATIHEIDTLLKKALQLRNFNGSVLVAYNGIPLTTSFRGYADFSRHEPINEFTNFQIASVSKSFTAMAIMILKERGQLNYEDLVQTHLPQFPYKNVTIRNLLNHTGGLQDYMSIVYDKWDKSRLLTNNDVLNLMVKYGGSLNFQPGTRFQYSNTGYAILASVVEKISGMSFPAFMEKNIFQELGMYDTFVLDSTCFSTKGTLAKPYRKVGRSHILIDFDHVDLVYGDKSIYSTVGDLLKWDRAVFESKLVSPTTMQDAFRQTVLKNKRLANYGFGWRLKMENNKPVIYHNGLWNGFTATITEYVEDKITVIITSNTKSHIAPILYDIQNILGEKNLMSPLN